MGNAICEKHSIQRSFKVSRVESSIFLRLWGINLRENENRIHYFLNKSKTEEYPPFSAAALTLLNPLL